MERPETCPDTGDELSTERVMATAAVYVCRIRTPEARWATRFEVVLYSMPCRADDGKKELQC
jgi:hypothetical protein